MTTLPDYAPPQSLEAEQATLGSVLVSAEAAGTTCGLLADTDFYLDAHRRIFDVIAYLSSTQRPVDVLTVAEELTRRGQLERVGGVAYLNSLLDSVPTAAHVEHYARIVAERSQLRQLLEAADQVRSLVHSREGEVDEIIGEAERLVLAVGKKMIRKGFTHLRSTLLEAMEKIEEVRAADSRLTGVTTGLTRMDQLTSGLQRGDLIIVAGRPSMGKTSLALGFGVAAAAAGAPVAIFSLEMSESQLAHRMICSEARVDSMRLRTGFLRSDSGELESDWARLGHAIGFLGDLPIYIDDSPEINPLEMRAKCRRLAHEQGLGLIIVDYLQLITGHGRQENRNQEISVIARALKSMARELDCPVVALSQLSRNVERREDKRPMLSDLRESGSIEAEADLVMMLYRSRYYSREEGDAEAEPVRGAEPLEESELIIAKHRNGPVGTVRLGFLRRYARFENLATEFDHAE